MDEWSFDCPQFVDFSAGLDNFITSDEVFFDGPASHGVQNKGYAAALVKMATPKMRPAATLRNSPFVKVERTLVTDDQKLAGLNQLQSRFSKSDGQLDKIIESLKSPELKENKKVFRNVRKRSLSEACIKEKKIFSTTPKCLKRTLMGSKMKKGKTTEELQLETITELQNKLKQHLQLNRMNLKRLKMNKAPFTLRSLQNNKKSKVPAVKSKNFDDVRILSQPEKPCYNNRKLPIHSETSAKNVPSSYGLNEPFQRLRVKSENSETVVKKMPSRNALQDLNGDNKNTLKKHALYEVYNPHGGIKFIPKQPETVPVNFSFDTSHASSCNASLRVVDKNKVHLSVPTQVAHSENKENMAK